MILTIIESYVSENNKYANAFVHSRIKEYLKNGINAKVFVLNNRSQSEYVYEGVHVICGDSKKLIEFCKENAVSGICIHFISNKILIALKKMRVKCPVFIFVHGNEALMWYERLFPDRITDFIQFLKFMKYIVLNHYNMFHLRSFFRNTNINYRIIFVSEWMKKITIKNWKLDHQDDKMEVIPNIINEDLFPFTKKPDELRFHILMIRHFSNGKYALDVAMDVIQKLALHKEFQKMKIHIIGKGRLFKKYTSMVEKYPNVIIENTFLSQSEIAKLHKQYGIFLCPTRQDAQGVSMCEAMSSGLIPITSNNTAIPEFLPKRKELLLDNSDDMVHLILHLIGHPETFQELSREVSRFIQKKCSKQNTTDKEIRLILESEKFYGE